MAATLADLPEIIERAKAKAATQPPLPKVDFLAPTYDGVNYRVSIEAVISEGSPYHDLHQLLEWLAANVAMHHLKINQERREVKFEDLEITEHALNLDSRAILKVNLIKE